MAFKNNIGTKVLNVLQTEMQKSKIYLKVEDAVFYIKLKYGKFFEPRRVSFFCSGLRYVKCNEYGQYAANTKQVCGDRKLD